MFYSMQLSTNMSRWGILDVARKMIYTHILFILLRIAFLLRNALITVIVWLLI